MISINQPYFFPNIGYFALLEQSNEHIFYDDVNMKKKSWITRNRFSPEDSLYSLKVQKLSQNRKISEHFIQDSHLIFDEIEQLFFNQNLEYRDLVFEIIQRLRNLCTNRISVADFNISTTLVLTQFLKINCEFQRSSSVSVSENFTGYQRLVKIISKRGFREYLNLESGKEIYCSEHFSDYGIDLYFNDTAKLKLLLPNDEFYKSILYVVAKYGLDRVQSFLRQNSAYISANKKMDKIPVLILVYDRVDKLHQLVESLRGCKLSELVALNIFSDAAKNQGAAGDILAVREYIRDITGFNEVNVIERKVNLGGLENGARALDEMQERYDFFITLEDDISVHRDFLSEMYKLALQLYDNNDIVSVSLYNTPNFEEQDTFYLSKIYNSWGALLWSHKRLLRDLKSLSKPRADMLAHQLADSVKKVHPKLPRYLERVDDGEKLTDYHATYLNIRNGTYQLRSYQSYINNHGYDGSGERCDYDNRLGSQNLNPTRHTEFDVSCLKYNPINDKLFYKFFHPKSKLIRRVKSFVMDRMGVPI